MTVKSSRTKTSSTKSTFVWVAVPASRPARRGSLRATVGTNTRGHPSRTAGQQKKPHPATNFVAGCDFASPPLKSVGFPAPSVSAVRHAQMDQQGASLSPVAGAGPGNGTDPAGRGIPRIFPREPGYILLPAKNHGGSVCF